MLKCYCTIVFTVFLFCVVESEDNKGKQVLNVCMDGKHHKTAPGPELSSLKKCSAWQKNSCCTNHTAHYSTDDLSPLYGFNLSHCAPMSQECKQWFYINNCFYECSPNVGPWIVTVSSSYRNEKIKNVPLCPSQCNSWWSACKDDYTCVKQWNTGFEWKSNPRANYCPQDKPCRKFTEMFHNATHFCENIYGPYDFRVAEDEENCIKIKFTGENPNVKVAKHFYNHQTEDKKENNENKTEQHIDQNGLLPPYQGPTTKPALLVHGTVASTVIAVLLVFAACFGISFYACKKWRSPSFRHQGVPVQFPSSIIRSKPGNGQNNDDRMAEMSFMQYDDDEEADENDDAPKLNGSLQIKP